MSQIKVEKISEEKLNELNVFTWPTWEKEVSRFDWHYDDEEKCYFIEGSVTVETKDGEKVSFGKGDFVTFPKGLSCVWDIKEGVKKHYKFG